MLGGLAKELTILQLYHQLQKGCCNTLPSAGQLCQGRKRGTKSFSPHAAAQEWFLGFVAHELWDEPFISSQDGLGAVDFPTCLSAPSEFCPKTHTLWMGQAEQERHRPKLAKC